MSLQTQFTKFDENIRLTWKDEKIKKIKEKNESICDDIREKFKEKGYSVKKFFQQGSYATNTAILPLDGDYDIDVGVVISSSDAPDDPVEPKKTLRDVLKARNFKDPRIKLPCVTAQYFKAGEKHFHLDYPVYKDTNDSYELAIGKEHSSSDIKKWEESDPKGLLDWLKKIPGLDEKELAQYRRIIKFLKRWRDNKFPEDDRKKLYSIGISVMVRESFIASISYDGDISDFDSLKKTLNNIISKNYFRLTSFDKNSNAEYDLVVNLPQKPYRDIFTKHTKTFGTPTRKRFIKLQDLLDEVEDAEGLVKKCEILSKKIFGDDFPIPSKDDEMKNHKFKEQGFVSSPQGA